MTMATDQKVDCRNNKVPLRKQSEIEEVEEQETSPGSDLSDSTITADKELASTEPRDSSPPAEDVSQYNSSECNHVQNNPKQGKLTRSKAFEITSPPLEQQNLLESPSNGMLTKSLSASKLEKHGSQSSEAGTSSSLSRDSSFDKSPYKDSTGIDLEEFIRKTLNKTQKDRSMLLKLETDINNFINEPKHHYLKFPQMSSYDRMLVHRISAFFGLDHNVDQTGKCVIVNKTSNTRVPDFSFREHIESGEPGHLSLRKPKMIMKRSVNSLDDRESHYKLSARSLGDTRGKAKSFEERKEQYEKVRSKIFKSVDDSGLQVEAFTEEEMAITQIYKADGAPVRPSSLSRNAEGNHLGSSTDSSGYGTDDRSSSRVRGLPKANSFGGITHVNQKQGGIHKGYSMNKADSFNCGMSMSMGGQRGIPTPPGSRTDSSPLSRCSSSGPVQSPIQGIFPGQGGQQVYIVATDLNNIPPGSVILDPRTGHPYSNSDGSVYHHTPGHPPPQHTTMVQQQQQQMPPEMWTNVPQPECQGVPEVCHHLSSLNLSQQSSLSHQNSLDSTGEPPGCQTSLQGGQQIVMATQPQMQTVFSQQGPTAQGQYYPCPQNMQTSNVRYMYPVQTSMAQGQPSVAVDNQTIIQSAPFQSQMTTGYPNYQGNTVQSVETVNQSSFPIHGASDSYQTYPVQYPSQSACNYGQMQSTLYYSNVPTSSPQMGLIYNGNQGQFQSQIQPSQTNPPLAMQGSTPMLNMGQPVAVGNVQTPNTHNYMYQTMAQVGQPQQQQRTPNPQIVQIPNVQVHNPTQTVPIIRNMQMNMQIPTQVGGIQQQQGLVAGQPSQVTVSAKNLTVEGTMPKYELENKDCAMGNFGGQVVAGPPARQFVPGFRNATQITDCRLLGQQTFRPQQQVQIHQQSYVQPQKQKSTGTTYSNKQQKLRKSRSRENDSSPHQSIDSNDSQAGHILEVCDLPDTMMRSEADKLLKDLVTSGAQIQFIHPENIQYQNEAGSLPVSAFHKILAIYPSSSGANQILKTHSNSKYKLRPSTLDNIGV
ncbi:cAMP-regulated phosphoprotein 21-like isoform X2 [Mytilus trossulus]|uniref:cAMP-regulated phosphoprotein 21-like isoform X2 n=1 Tax=Mytilus trossulus TaxID=6551 RepID=UPI003004480D